jgi:hypothetical protein
MTKRQAAINKATLKTNDGRPPDTSKELVPTKKHDATSEAIQKPKKVGRKPGGQNTKKDPQLTIQGYIHFDNTCYITCGLTGFYAGFCFLKMQGFSLEIDIGKSKGLLLRDILEHLETRYCSFQH